MHRKGRTRRGTARWGSFKSSRPPAEGTSIVLSKPHLKPFTVCGCDYWNVICTIRLTSAHYAAISNMIVPQGPYCIQASKRCAADSTITYKCITKSRSATHRRPFCLQIEVTEVPSSASPFAKNTLIQLPAVEASPPNSPSLEVDLVLQVPLSRIGLLGKAPKDYEDPDLVIAGIVQEVLRRGVPHFSLNVGRDSRTWHVG